jgi:hypothetical protein
MKRLSWLAAVAVVIALTIPVRASAPPIVGSASGIELCEQAVCGSAIFVAIFNGQAGNNPHTLGTIIVSVTHDPLPGPNETVNLKTGVWLLQPIFGRPISGTVMGGTIHNNDGDGTFDIVANMHVTNGPAGDVTFEGTLSHNAFPPTLIGHIQ